MREKCRPYFCTKCTKGILSSSISIAATLAISSSLLWNKTQASMKCKPTYKAKVLFSLKKFKKKLTSDFLIETNKLTQTPN